MAEIISTEEEQIQFYRHLVAPIVRDLVWTGHLSDDIRIFWRVMQYPSSVISRLEHELDLPVTGKLDLLESNYKQNRYTIDSFGSREMIFCLEGAIQHGHVEGIVRAIDSAKISSDQIAASVLQAAAFPNVDAIRTILMYLPSDTLVRDQGLKIAVEAKHDSVVAFLAPTVHDVALFEAMTIAISIGWTEGVEILLISEAAIPFVNRNGSALIIAEGFKIAFANRWAIIVSILTPLLTENFKHHLFVEACHDGNLSLISFLGNRVNLESHERGLWAAGQNQHFAIVRCLANRVSSKYRMVGAKLAFEYLEFPLCLSLIQSSDIKARIKAVHQSWEWIGFCEMILESLSSDELMQQLIHYLQQIILYGSSLPVNATKNLLLKQCYLRGISKSEIITEYARQSSNPEEIYNLRMNEGLLNFQKDSPVESIKILEKKAKHDSRQMRRQARLELNQRTKIRR